MLVKLAIMSPWQMLSAAATVGSTTANAAIGSNAHDIGHFLFSKANRFGKAVQRSAVADAIIAAKKAKDGKVFGNRTIGGLGLYMFQPQKMLAMHEANQLVHHMPNLIKDHVIKFDKNKLNVKRLKNVLGASNTINNSAAALQVVAPAGMGVHEYNKARREGKSKVQAFKEGLGGAASGAAISAALVVPRLALRGASGMHQSLAEHGNYGYRMLDEAAHSAAKSMNRPGILNYSKHVYVTPQQNLKGKAGFITDAVNKAMGVSKARTVDAVNDYGYNKAKPSLFQRIKDKADEIPKAFGINLK